MTKIMTHKVKCFTVQISTFFILAALSLFLHIFMRSHSVSYTHLAFLKAEKLIFLPHYMTYHQFSCSQNCLREILFLFLQPPLFTKRPQPSLQQPNVSPMVCGLQSINQLNMKLLKLVSTLMKLVMHWCSLLKTLSCFDVSVSSKFFECLGA